MKYLLAITFFFILTSAYASPVLFLDGDNANFNCNFRSSVTTREKIESAIHKMNFSLDCLNEDQIRFIKKGKENITGITFGVNGAIAKGIGVDAGSELVVMVYDDHTLMVGLVDFYGGGAGVGLPLGASITTGVIHGECNTIDQYLGNFQNFSFLGLNKSFGTADELKKIYMTKCNASSNTDGLSMSLLGYTMTRYQKASEFFMVKGERVKELIKFIQSSNKKFPTENQISPCKQQTTEKTNFNSLETLSCNLEMFQYNCPKSGMKNLRQCKDENEIYDVRDLVYECLRKNNIKENLNFRMHKAMKVLDKNAIVYQCLNREARSEIICHEAIKI